MKSSETSRVEKPGPRYRYPREYAATWEPLDRYLAELRRAAEKERSQRSLERRQDGPGESQGPQHTGKPLPG